MKTYAIMRVSDYKGGELHPEINLSYEDFVFYIGEEIQWKLTLDPIEIVSSKGENYSKYVIDEVTKLVKNGFVSNYAGGDEKWCGTVYEVENSRMKKIKIEDHLPAICKSIIENIM